MIRRCFKRLDHYLRLLPFALFCAIISANASADTQDTGKSLRLNISPHGYPPYLIVEGETPSGILWDVMTTIAPRLGYELIPRKIPRKRVDNMLLDGYIDGTFRAIEWTEKPENYLFTQAVVNVEEVLFFNRESATDYSHPSDLFGHTVVAHLGYKYPSLAPYFEQGKIKRFNVSSDKDLFRYVLLGDRFDAALADRLVGQWILRNEGLTNQFRSSTGNISQYGYRLMLRKDWAEFAQGFNRELAAMRENGELDAILANYR
ncbi:MAG: amino acid ABC transporter substrate-binding protein [Gammaproteobacteria bacterium]|uniref:Bacterial extracellular solute-binding protein, family 3 n=1 Tax=Marinobacter litoralis TaxID=187981 RepID=A0A3M2R9U3_9GAMM|nr:transporter substrate-binding domain-containing protein [Marinobacter litoralis]MBR9869650.1 amino acid ABC transporter substrate-binding protein [Gammaproteobacteria bacterium]RMJ02056.1 Bacterial extracellular solute-binding protein, family 3 [Marinobacter litoralis]